MRSNWLLLFMGLVACGGDDEQMVDANKAPTFEYDLSCLNTTPSPVPTTVHITGWLAHITSKTDGGSIAYTPVRVESSDGTTTLATATSADNGIFDVDIATGGVLTPVRLAFEPTDWGKQRWYGTRAPWRSTASGGDYAFFGAKPLRTFAIAAALGQASDDTKGTVEVWASDCRWKPMRGATITIEEHPDAQWVHYNAVGSWIPGATTIAPDSETSETWSATPNIAPGTKTVTVTANGMTIGTVQILVEANSFNRVFVVPGYVDIGGGF